LEHFL